MLAITSIIVTITVIQGSINTLKASADNEDKYMGVSEIRGP